MAAAFALIQAADALSRIYQVGQRSFTTVRTVGLISNGFGGSLRSVAVLNRLYGMHKDTVSVTSGIQYGASRPERSGWSQYV